MQERDAGIPSQSGRSHKSPLALWRCPWTCVKCCVFLHERLPRKYGCTRTIEMKASHQMKLHGIIIAAQNKLKKKIKLLKY